MYSSAVNFLNALSSLILIGFAIVVLYFAAVILLDK